MKAILIAAVMLCACSESSGPVPEWRMSPSQYTCTEQQMQRVQNEASWCDRNTSFLNTYCYGSAIIRNCTKRPA